MSETLHVTRSEIPVVIHPKLESPLLLERNSPIILVLQILFIRILHVDMRHEAHDLHHNALYDSLIFSSHYQKYFYFVSEEEFASVFIFLQAAAIQKIQIAPNLHVLP